MQAIWQLFDATIVPIMTYGSEGWNLSKKEENQLQTIHNRAIKTILALPQGTPTNILLTETGQVPLKYTMKKKKTMQAHRLENKKDSLVKRNTNNEHSLWKQMIKQIMQEYHQEEKHLQISKDMLKKLLDHMNKEKFQEEIEAEAQNKSKVRKWKENHRIEIAKRPRYMERLTRKQCSAILRARAGMLPVKANQKRQHKEDLRYRFCKQQEETQEHILIECPTLQPTADNIDYKKLNDDQDLDQLRRIANHIMATERKMEDITWSSTKVRTVKTTGISPKIVIVIVYRT